MTTNGTFVLHIVDSVTFDCLSLFWEEHLKLVKCKDTMLSLFCLFKSTESTMVIH